MFRKTHIRTKLAAALVVPLAALVAVAGFEVVAAQRQVDEVRSQTALATSSVGPGSLLIHLQDERNRAAIDLIGLGEAADLPVAENAEARALVDEAIDGLRGQLAGRGSAVDAVFAPAWEALERLDVLRADVDDFEGPFDISSNEFADEVFGRYTDIIEAFFDATSTVALAVDEAELRNGVEIIDAAARQSEMRARIVRSLVLAVVTGTADEPATLQEVAALHDRAAGFDDDIATNATGPYAGVADATFEEDGVRSFVEQVDAYLAGDDANIIELLDSVASDPDIGYTGLRNRTADLLAAEADRIEDEAVARQRLFVAVALGALLVALAVSWVASRSITRPLRSLRSQAEEMAGTRLPAAVRQILDTPDGEDVVIPDVTPIEVRTRDEVADVAAALSAVQASAVDLAVEQAVLRRNISDSYVNLGRRNQNLLSRQLDFITELERNQSDPDALEGLFRLDHLATRMRRNAESLLVLAGVAPPRQWSAPVRLGDVVRAALGEVEDYQRVIVRHLEPASITGAVAADVAHVLAELIENALTFSPPEQPVEVKGRTTAAGYTVAITDNGLGMSPEELSRANRRLAGEESFTVAPSRYLGHYVAGHLASRVGMEVQLQDSPAGGITARIDVPSTLLADSAAVPAPLAAPSALPPATHTAAEPAHLAAPAGPRPAAQAAASSTEEAAVPDAADVTGFAAASFEQVDQPPAGLTANGLPRRGERPRPDAPDTPAARATGEDTEPPMPRGFGGLAATRPSHGSMYSIAARMARGEDVADGAEQAGTTPTGLARRVPGAQRPDADFARQPEHEWGAGEAETGHARRSPADVYTFLSSFQSGVARGRADAHFDDAEHQEDER